MTVTETPPTSDAPPTTEIPAPQPTGIAGLLGSGDHKAIGRLYVAFALLFGVAALAATGLARLENLSDGGPLSEAVVFQVFTASQIGLVFAFLAPLFVGLAFYLVPLQIGSATIAFPRAAALSFWGWLAGVATLIIAYGLDGGIGGTNARAVDLGLLALLMVLASLLLAAVCIATTVITLRAEGMSVDRVPMFSWSMLAASGVWLLTWPVLVGNLVLIRVDVDNAGLLFGAPGDQWAQLMWAFLLPQIYALAIPVLGVLGDAVPTLAGRRQASRGVLLVAIGAFAALSLGAWAQPAQIGDIWSEPLFIGVAFAILLPLLACLGGWGTTLRGGTKLASPLLFGIGGLLLLLLAGIAGALFSVEPLQLQEVVLPFAAVPIAALGQAELVVAATAAGALAAISFWGPKLTGGRLAEAPGALGALVVLAGGAAWGVPSVVLGFQARFTGLADATDALTVLSVVGLVLVLAGVVIGAFGLLASRRGPEAGADPWGRGQTLEWACPSPPPRANVGRLETVRSAEPLLDDASPGEDNGSSEGGDA